MKLAFIPGNLHLSQSQDGFYLVTVHNQEILRTRSRQRAIQKFKEVRQQMENAYPAKDVTPEERIETLRKAVAEEVSTDRTPRKKKKTSAGSTRTFGG